LITSANMCEEYPPARLPLHENARPYSIRIPDVSAEISCPGCGVRFYAAGPTGYAAEEPLCDSCLLTASKPLGMVLALVSKARVFADRAYESHDAYREALAELGEFARRYESTAIRLGPPRRILSSIFNQPA